MRVLWLVRRGLTDHAGGDTTQILNTADALRRLGLQIELSDSPRPGLAGFDLAHLFHLDRLWENDYHARRLRRAGLPFVLSTIWWPGDEFDAGARGGLQGRMARFVGSRTYRSLRVIQRSLMHTAATGALRFWHPRLLRFSTAARHLLEAARVLLPNSEAEREQITGVLGVERPCVIVPNAADARRFTPPDDPAASRRGVLCVGRIEPRKNQLNLVRALCGTEIPLTLVGPVGRYNRSYRAQCELAAGPQTTFLPQQDAAGLAELYRQARVHACVSWYETPGLASLEAALCGCALVVTRGGCTREYFGDDAHYADAGDSASIREAVLNGLQRGTSEALLRRVRSECTWDAAAQATLRGYAQALGRK